ncbi:ABC transporter substrate-binding protein [Anaeromicropila populeti]|uniref:ABC-type glycerol-3-phosphate transport system, substrate-binding protein n=1 Tax=Anaeromicropila populeti TaxID=37658 RepID=A0A1I6LJT7_9FIRM|nr:ABC transporter substrate-binding protein [Anaeromicropila populeti]SFS03729.1 ABC-type glycerol-3-phosphate transport system, substrate-binding protein [Anaeromicropila populeti]
MKLRKILALMLTFVLAFSLAACGSSKDSNSDKTETETPTEVSASEPAETEVEATEEATDMYPAFDMAGRTIKVGIWWDYFYTSDHTSIEDDPGLTNTETAQMKLDNVRRIEEKYNVKIQFVNLGWDGIKESINTSILAGTPECDIYLTDLQFGIPAVLNGLAQDLSKLDIGHCDINNDQVVMKPLEALGGTYLFSEQGLPVNGIYLGYNKTMIQDLGLEDPQELYNNGEWTWDKFAELATAATKDTDGDSNVDTYGYGGVFTDLVNGLVMNNGGEIAATGTEGLSSKETTEVFDFINKLYNEDKVARPWNTDDWNDNLLSWSTGKTLFWTAQAWSLKQEADAAVSEGAPLAFEYSVVPYPTGPSGDASKIYSPVSGNWYIIPIGVSEPEKVYQVFEEFMNWHQGDTEYRDDPSWFESCFLTDEDIALALKCGETPKLDLWTSLGGSFDLGSDIFNPICVTKEKTVAQAVESSKQKLQDDLDNTGFFK